MIGHQRFRELLARRAELSPAEELTLQVHLDGCPDCREIAAAYARQTTLLRALPEVVPPAALRSGVLQAVRNPAPAPVAVPLWRRMPALGALAAAVLIAAGLGLSQLHPSGSRQAAGGNAPLARSTPKLIYEGAKHTVAAKTVPARRAHPNHAHLRVVPAAHAPKPSSAPVQPAPNPPAAPVQAPSNAQPPAAPVPVPTPTPPSLQIAAAVHPSPGPSSTKRPSGRGLGARRTPVPVVAGGRPAPGYSAAAPVRPPKTHSVAPAPHAPAPAPPAPVSPPAPAPPAPASPIAVTAPRPTDTPVATPAPPATPASAAAVAATPLPTPTPTP